MKVFLDESVTGKARLHLEKMFRHDMFIASGREVEKGLSDLDVYAAARDEGATVYICSDIKQLTSPDRTHERAACRRAGLHWIGVPHSHAKGKRKSDTEVIRLLEGFGHVRAELESAATPTAVLLRRPDGCGDHIIDRIEDL